MTRFTPQMRALGWLTARPIAHRGFHNLNEKVVENTESAFAGAMKHNYAIECDLQLAADGEAVVFHDETLERVTEQTGWVKDRTSHELRKVKFKQGSDRIQTLAELLEQVDGRVTLIIELKSHFDGNTELVTRTLETMEKYTGPHCMMSFDPTLIAAVAALSPNTVRGITADRTTDPYYRMLPFAERVNLRHFEHLDRTKPHFISYNFRDLPFAPVQAIRAAGHPIITWTIRSKEEERQALRYSDQVTFESYAA
jgi:glycerophosphoryl diester phosphodiesterase